MAEEGKDTEKSNPFSIPARVPHWVKEGRKPVAPDRETLVKGIAKMQDISPWKVEKIASRRKREAEKAERRLTGETLKLNTNAMAGPGETGTETKELPHVPPFTETPKERIPLYQRPAAKAAVKQAQEQKTIPSEANMEQAQRPAWEERVLARNRAERIAAESAPEPEETPMEPVSIPSQEPAPAAAPWIKQEQERMVKGTHKEAAGQAGQKPTPSIREQRAQRAIEQLIETKTKAPIPPPSSSEQVAAAQSVRQGQEIRKHWYDRIPFLKILRGERRPAS